MSDAVAIDQRASKLGEGPLWHPKRKMLFWFDILGKKLLADDGQEWQFDEHVSAAGWVSDSTLLIASETRLFRFDLDFGTDALVCELDADDPLTRSNDGRADPWGGFWIGTMGKNAEHERGAIYRYFDGELRQLFAPITISNAICFAPDKSVAYFTDSARKKVMQVPLEAKTGWPVAPPDLFYDFSIAGESPDGAVVAADGSVLIALWGSSCVARLAPDAQEIERFAFPTAHITCPALGGRDLSTLYATSAQQGLSADDLAAQPGAGKTFMIETAVTGLPEYRVQL